MVAIAGRPRGYKLRLRLHLLQRYRGLCHLCGSSNHRAEIAVLHRFQYQSRHCVNVRFQAALLRRVVKTRNAGILGDVIIDILCISPIFIAEFIGHFRFDQSHKLRFTKRFLIIIFGIIRCSIRKIAVFHEYIGCVLRRDIKGGFQRGKSRFHALFISIDAHLKIDTVFG